MNQSYTKSAYDNVDYQIVTTDFRQETKLKSIIWLQFKILFSLNDFSCQTDVEQSDSRDWN